MEELMNQFILLEKKCTELLETNKALKVELNKTKKTNKLLEENYRVGEEGEINKSETNNQGQVNNKRQESTSAEIASYIKEIDECLDILKTIEG